MTTRQYIAALKAHWVTVIIATLVGALLGGASAMLLPARYSASTTLYFAVQGTGEAGSFSPYDGTQLAQQRLKLGEGLVRTGRVAQTVIERLRLQKSPKEVSQELVPTADVDSGLLVIDVSDTSPARAAEIANAAADVVVKLMTELDPAAAAVPVTVVPRIVEVAKPPLGSPAMRSIQFVLGGMLAGLLVGAGIAIVRATANPSIRDAEALANATQAKTLGLVLRTAKPHTALPGATEEAPGGAALADSIRRLRAVLDVQLQEHASKIVVFTSPMAGAGVTSVVAHLGQSFAKAGLRVALVDANGQSPGTTASMFGLSDGPGLIEILEGSSSLEGALRSPTPGLDVLSRGALTSEIGELLGSEGPSRILKHLSETHDVVLVDAPPVLSSSDVLSLAPLSDGVVLVCRFGTSRSMVAAAVAALRGVSPDLWGAILTRVPVRDAVFVSSGTGGAGRQTGMPGSARSAGRDGQSIEDATPAESGQPAAAGADSALRPKHSPAAAGGSAAANDERTSTLSVKHRNLTPYRRPDIP